MIPSTARAIPLLATLCGSLMLGTPLRAQQAGAPAEPEISEEERAAADQLVMLTFYGDPAEEALTQGLGQFAKQYPEWIRGSLIADGLPEAQADRLLAERLEESRRRAVRTLAERLSAQRQFRIALRKMIQELYLESYSLDELRQLIAFWSSPVGRKLYRLNPVIASERKNRAAELIRQPLYKLSAQVVIEETRTLTGSD